ncbi:MAG: hypothetical protein BMS9Abin31_1190 [Gammaproteobacteria bacterium]|nr:MAG: hypothetical protein BMS9Abin31_1190 [Gammaproteobacteria bacterium]
MSSPNDPLTRAAFWQQHVLQWRESQQSQIAYCKEHTLDFPRFNYWLRKYDPLKPEKEPIRKPSAFIPVVTHQAPVSGLSLSLPNGMMVQCIDSNNLGTVKQLVDILL